MVVTAGGLAKAEDGAAKQNDAQITQQEKQKLGAGEPNMAPRIMVSTHDGVVPLMQH